MGYTTWDSSINSSELTYSDGDLTVTRSGSIVAHAMTTTVASMDDTKKYQIEVDMGAGGGPCYVGVGNSSCPVNNADYIGKNANSWAYYVSGNKANAASSVAYGDAFTTGGVITIAVSVPEGKIWFGLGFDVDDNPIWQNSGDPIAGTNPAFDNLTGNDFKVMISMYSNGAAMTATANFGASAFTGNVLSGYEQGINTTVVTTVDCSTAPFSLSGTIQNPTSQQVLNVTPFGMTGYFAADAPFVGVVIDVEPFISTGSIGNPSIPITLNVPVFSSTGSMTISSIEIIIPPVVSVSFQQQLKSSLEMAFSQALGYNVNVVVTKSHAIKYDVTQGLSFRHSLKLGIRDDVLVNFAQKILTRALDANSGIKYGSYRFNKRHGL